VIAGAMARLRSLVRGIRGRRGVEAEMQEEFALHVALRAEDLVRGGMAPEAARRQARLEFGSVERWKHEARGSRGLLGVDALHVSWLDFKLGFRMLGRYPGLTLVGGLAMAFAIWVGAGAFEVLKQVAGSSLPLPQGDRIVLVEMRDAATGGLQPRVTHDVVAWQSGLETLEEVGAFRTLERNLVSGDGVVAPVEVAEVTTNAFRLAGVRPALGRALVEADARPGAPPVAVIGHSLWTTRFAADSTVVGRPMRLGDSPVTIVGVMPEGFGFPVAQRFWVPLRLDPLAHAPGEGPSLSVFGRLAPGATLAQAQAELSTYAQRAAAVDSATYRNLRPRVGPYARTVLGLDSFEAAIVRSANLFLVMLVALICGNVALLLFARAATREAEITVRTALGATRGRIVAQLFAEALVLGGVAAAVGLAFTNAGLRWMFAVFAADAGRGSLPFWFRPGLSPETIAYALLLALAGAALAGVLPALKVTRGLQQRLRETSGGGGGLRFGGVWTAIIVSQIAVTMVFPMIAHQVRKDGERFATKDVGFPESQYLTAQLRLDREAAALVVGDTSRAALAARFRLLREEIERRLLADPAVAGVTVAERVPRMYHPHRRVRLDAGPAAPHHRDYPGAYRVSSAHVDADFFETLETPILAGRSFRPGEIGTDARVAVVNESFVRLVLGGHNPIGRRVHYMFFEGEGRFTGEEEPGPWYEIVGVVPDIGEPFGSETQGSEPFEPQVGDPKVARLYHPLGSEDLATTMAIRARGDPLALEPRLRAAAAAVDPTMRVADVIPLADLSNAELEFIDFWFKLMAIVSAIAIVLSLSGIYAVMSFTVARRTREIGVRVALGGDARRVVLAVLRRPLRQVAGGVVAGIAVLGLIIGAASQQVTLRAAALLAAYGACMFAVCLLACIVPTRRALAVEPTEALRAE